MIEVSGVFRSCDTFVIRSIFILSPFICVSNVFFHFPARYWSVSDCIHNTQILVKYRSLPSVPHWKYVRSDRPACLKSLCSFAYLSEYLEKYLIRKTKMTAAINKSGDGIFIPMMIQASVPTVKIYRKTLYCLILSLACFCANDIASSSSFLLVFA